MLVFKLPLYCLLTLSSVCAFLINTLDDFQPQQVHIAYSDKPSQLTITWNTVDNPQSSIVEYGIHEKLLNLSASGSIMEFVDGGLAKRKQYIHKTKLVNLSPGKKYFYRCGSELGWSNIFHFTAMKSGNKWSPKFAVYGDLGSENPQSLPRLQKEVQKGFYDAILHVGDFGYDLDEDDGRVGDLFMRQIEPIAAYVPYMTTVGNHEGNYNFSHYKARFYMPGSENNMLYSFDIGPAHIISLSTEFYYFIEYGFKSVALQYEWLIKDLKKANLPENRRQRPWIITMGHRPMYCSNDDHDDCTNDETIIRVGLPVFHWFPLEPLLYKYGVDLAIWAHEHSYERMFPVYNRTVYNGSLEHPYVNPKATVHVTTGSAGCRERKDSFVPEVPPWTAFRSSDYGYSRLNIVNHTHLYMEQVSDDLDGQVIDHFWMVKDEHRSFIKP